jgi:hypothetical protein
MQLFTFVNLADKAIIAICRYKPLFYNDLNYRLCSTFNALTFVKTPLNISKQPILTNLRSAILSVMNSLELHAPLCSIKWE